MDQITKQQKLDSVASDAESSAPAVMAPRAAGASIQDACCPHCGQRMLMRYGVKLSPMQAAVLDRIEHGNLVEQMLWVLFPGKPNKVARNLLRVHVNQINDRLQESAEYFIRCFGRGPDARYRLLKVVSDDAVSLKIGEPRRDNAPISGS